MRRSSISVRVGAGGGSEMDDAVLARRSLIEELLSRQYDSSNYGVKNEKPNEEIGLLGCVTLIMSKWDNKSHPSSVPSKTKSKTTTPKESVNVDLHSGRSNLNALRLRHSGGIDGDSNSNRSYSFCTGESDTMRVMIDEDDTSLEEYEDEELDGGDYDYGEDDDLSDDDGLEDIELTEALRIVRGRKSWNINDFRARYKTLKCLKRKADSDDNDNFVSMKNVNSITDSQGDLFDGKPIRMVKIIIGDEHSENPSMKNSMDARLLREKYMRVVQSAIGSSPRDSFFRDNQDKSIFNNSENSSSSTTCLEAYGPVDGEVSVYF